MQNNDRKRKGTKTKRDNADPFLALPLAQGKVVREAAEIAGVSEATAYRRWADPEFRAQVAKLRDEMFEVVMGKLLSHMSAAADKLSQLKDSNLDAVALGACKAILTIGLAARDQLDLAKRVAEIEAALSLRKEEPTSCDE